MAATDSTQIFLQYPIFTRFILPFILVFALVFGILEKTNVLGNGKQKLNAIVAFVMGLIFITVLSPTVVLSNLVLFLSISLVVVFVILMIWGFFSGEDSNSSIFKVKGVKWTFFGILVLAVLFGVLWAFGVSLPSAGNNLITALFKQSWSSSFWTNVIFGVLVAAALALVLIGGKAAKGGK